MADFKPGRWTPGPWASQYMKHGWIVGRGECVAGDYVADVHEHVVPAPDWEANAHLIAAAPDHDTALLAFHRAMSDWYDGPEHPATPELLEAWAMARKSLARARGEKP